MVTARIAGLGTALPAAYEQDRLWRDAFREHFSGNRIAKRVFADAGVDRRHSVTDPAEFAAVTTWTTGERMRRFIERAPPLGLSAVREALADAGIAAEEIGLMAVVSCTGYGTPGLDIELARELPLPADARRLLVGHMGCHAAIPGLGAAAEYVQARSRPAVLLCLELTSLHLQPPSSEVEQMITHALFADAAAAIVLRPGDEGPGPRVVDLAARTDTAKRDHMTWHVTDLGFRMGLSPRVPDVLGEHIGPVVEDLLSRNGLKVSDVGSWAVHPGGPRVLDAVRDGLGLDASALEASRTVLAEHGNCSSVTVMLVIRELLENGPPPGPMVAVAFGPGLTLYAALIQPR